MDMRDKIAGVKYMGTTVGHGVADAILTDMPNMVNLLVWSHISSTGDRNVHEASSLVGRYVAWPNGQWKLWGTYQEGMAEDPTLEAAQAAATDHYVKQVMASFGIML